MGVVNLTDDSFYAKSRMAAKGGLPDIGRTLERVGTMVREGADIIDIGACSTRPGSSPVGAEAEWARVGAVLPRIREEFPSLRISIDTFEPEVIRRCVEAVGPVIVNDVTSGGQGCPYGSGEMLRLAASLGLTYIAMHWAGDTSMTPVVPEGADITQAVCDFFDEFSDRADKAGLTDWWLDPGFSFSKTIAQNYSLLGGLARLKTRFARPLLIGVSRKSFIWKPLGITPEEALPATQVVHLRALEGGADILRVHDVAQAIQTIRLYGHIQQD